MLLRLKSIPIFLMLALLLAASLPTLVSASSAPPTIISYQGRLTDNGGNLLGGSGTTYYFKFSIWDSTTVGTGNRVWPPASPATTTATVRQGVFNVNIGDTAGGYPDQLNINFANYSALYLQVEVSSDNLSSETLTPRQQLSSAIYAQVAGAVVGTTTPSAFGTTTPALNSFVTIAATSSNSIPLSLIGASGQSANLFQIQNNSLTNLFSITSSGAATLGSTLAVTSSTTIAGVFNSTFANILGSTTLSGATLLTNATTTGSLAVFGSTTLSSLLNIGGSLNANAGGTFSGTFAGAHTYSGAVTFSSTIGVTGLSTLTGGLTTTGATSTGTFAVTSSTTISGLLNVGGALNANGALAVAGTSNFVGLATFTSASTTQLSASAAYFGGTATTTFLANGNVGLGTSSPFALLSVAGNGYFNGNITGSNITATGTLQTVNILATASSTIGNGTQTGGLTINGGATTTGNALVQTPTNSSLAFQVQNSQSAPIFLVDTTTTNYLVNPGFEVNTTGWALDGATSLTRITNTKYHGIASLQVVTPATSNTGVKNSTFNTALVSATSYTLSFYAQAVGSSFTTLRAGRADDGSTEVACTLNSTTVVTGGWTRYSCSFTTGTISGSPYIFIEQSDATLRTFNIDAVQLQTGSSITPYQIGGIQLRGVITTPLSLNATTNSVTAFQVQNASSTSNLLIADTLNNVLNIATSTGLALFSMQGTSTQEIAEIASSTGASLFHISKLGNVGIGTSSPFALLSVAGNGYFNGSLTVLGTSNFVGLATFASATSTSLVVSSAGGVGTRCAQFLTDGTLQANASACGSGGGASLSVANVWTALQQFNANASTTQLSASAAYFGGTATSTFTSAGFLGVGTTSPFANLSIHANNGALSTTLFAIGSSTQNATTTLFSISNTGNIVHGVSIAELVPNNTTNVFSIGTSTTAQPIFSVSSQAGVSVGGLVGIATSSPWGKFSIEMGTFHPSLVVSNQGSSTTAFMVSGVNQNGRVGVGSTTPWGQLSIDTTSLGNSPAFTLGTQTNIQFIVSNTGNVGIGTTSPYTKFALYATSTPSFTNTVLFNIASSSATGAATTDLFSISNTGNGYLAGKLGIATSTPWASFSIAESSTTASMVVGVVGSSSPAFYIGSANQNGFVGIATSSVSATTTVFVVGNSTLPANKAVAEFGNATALCFIVPGASVAGFSCSSDLRLKKNINELSPALDLVMALNPVTYNWNSEADGSALHTGFIAQQVQKIFPELIYTADNGMLSLDYAAFTPYLASAIQAQQIEIASSTASTTPEYILGGPFASASSGLKAALTDTLHALDDIAHAGVRELGAAVHASTGVFDKLFAREVHTDMLCVGTTCVSQEQFMSMVKNAGVQASAPAPDISVSVPAPDSATSTNDQAAPQQ